MSIASGGPNSIPFLDLITPHVELERELTEVFRQALHTAGFIGGPVVENFEIAFASFCDAEYAVAVNSGTDALRFALIAAGIKQGDVVITVPHTFIATTEAISQAGAIPEFVDIDERTYNMDPEKLREYLETGCYVDTSGRLVSKRNERRISAIVPVHLYGQCADMDTILDLAHDYHLIVIEDACQAHGAEYFSRRHNRWMKAGTIGIAAAFSFYPGKNLGACGEAGAITTNDASIATTIRMLRDHGQSKKYHHDMEGYNGRLDAMQAGILHTKLRYLTEWNSRRREIASTYSLLLDHAGESITLPYEPSWSRSVYHLYTIRTEDRAGLMAHLNSAHIGTGIHYPVPLHLQKAYSPLGHILGDFPVSERVAADIISLPIFPQLSHDQLARVSEETIRFVQKRSCI